ncbi:MAG: secondary thiamine-phosphate synthase enzyme YjbQ [Candidatus Omnitrophica bacterium]|nr:secondary thiamine-phosphate synthase enzyme YjbQ [Candidatus Omnitrophota bacterium]
MLTIKSNKEREIIDITEDINKFLVNQKKENGLVFLFALHTTCALTTADLDPGAEKDYLTAFEKIEPKTNYIHPHNPEHFPEHFLSSIVGTSLLLPFENKKLILGTWQRVILIEFDGPRERKIFFKIVLSQ